MFDENARMENEARKADIRRRLTLAKYPRRSRAKFTDDNDHNPMVLQDCRRCQGSGRVCRHFEHHGRQVKSREECSECDGKGVTGEVERYFTNDDPEVDAPVRNEGTTCPTCGWRFRLSDPHAWTGRRHLRCGQKLRLVE